MAATHTSCIRLFIKLLTKSGGALALLACLPSPSAAADGVILQILENAQEPASSVSQLSDVRPTDWAYAALQSLAERYGCITGYPDGSFRGNAAISRYEFAAGLNACLQQVSDRLSQALSREDITILQRLQEEFAAELVALRAETNALEAQAAELEANQFSTTTRLRGTVSLSGNSLFGTERAGDSGEDLDENVTFNYRVRLNFDTSFIGRDLLKLMTAVRKMPMPLGTWRVSIAIALATISSLFLGCW